MLHELAPETKTNTRSSSKKNHGQMDSIRQAPRHLQETMLEETSLQLMYAFSNDIYGAETWALTTQANNKLAAAQTNMERSMLNITYRDRKTNIWVRETINVTDVTEQVRRRM